MSDLSYPVVKAAELAGVRKHQLQRWQKHGLLNAIPRGEGRVTQHRYTEEEINVAKIMGMLMAAGFGDLKLVHRLARQHIADLAVLAAMGYSGEQMSTEHTIGDGLLLTITG